MCRILFCIPNGGGEMHPNLNEIIKKTQDVCAKLKEIKENAENGCAKSQFIFSQVYDAPTPESNGYGGPIFKWLEASAENGDIDSQYKLALLWHHGNSKFPRNYRKALRLYQMAAKNGHIKAAFNLAEFYEHGKFLPKNISKANELLRKCAIEGDEKALYVFDLDSNSRKIGPFGPRHENPYRYDPYGYNFLHIKPSYVEKLKWCRMSAEQGYIPAQLSLAEYFGYGMNPIGNDGTGVEDYQKESLKWYLKAAKQGNEEAQSVIMRRDNSKLQKFAEQGNAEAQLRLAVQYRREAKNPQDIQIAKKWYKAAQKKSVGSHYRWLFDDTNADSATYDELFARYYKKAIHGNLDAASNLLIINPYDVELTTSAAQHGSLDAQISLSCGFYSHEDWLCYEYDDKDCERYCYEWTLKAAEQGDTTSQAMLGEIYIDRDKNHGIGSNSFNWRKKAASQGDERCQMYLGLIYKESHQNDDALLWLLRAAVGGNGQAFEELGSIYEYDDPLLSYCFYLLSSTAKSEKKINSLENRLTVSEIDEGNQRALDWLTEDNNTTNWLVKKLKKAEAKLMLTNE